MLLIDVNVLIYAHRKDAVQHEKFRDWLAAQISGESSFAYSDLILSAVLRVVTNRGIYAHPTPLEDALRFVQEVRDCPHSVRIETGARHWSIFSHLCSSVKARGNLVTDCYQAALAIEHGCEWITTDRHFARFPALRWRHPLA